MSGIVRSDPKFGLSVEIGTAAVPDDGRYHVLADGELIFSTGVEAAAVAEYDELRAARMAPGRNLLRRERADDDYHAHRAKTWADKSARDARKGGRGVGR